MSTPGYGVIRDDGSLGLLADGLAALFNGDGECQECCQPLFCLHIYHRFWDCESESWSEIAFDESHSIDECRPKEYWDQVIPLELAANDVDGWYTEWHFHQCVNEAPTRKVEYRIYILKRCENGQCDEPSYALSPPSNTEPPESDSCCSYCFECSVQCIEPDADNYHPLCVRTGTLITMEYSGKTVDIYQSGSWVNLYTLESKSLSLPADPENNGCHIEWQKYPDGLPVPPVDPVGTVVHMKVTNVFNPYWGTAFTTLFVYAVGKTTAGTVSYVDGFFTLAGPPQCPTGGSLITVTHAAYTPGSPIEGDTRYSESTVEITIPNGGCTPEDCEGEEI